MGPSSGARTRQRDFPSTEELGYCTAPLPGGGREVNRFPQETSLTRRSRESSIDFPNTEELGYCTCPPPRGVKFREFLTLFCIFLPPPPQKKTT